MNNNPSALPPTDSVEDPMITAMREYGWPPALAKASCDPFFYAAFVEDLGVVIFTDAEHVSPGWVRLMPAEPDHYDSSDIERLPFAFDRGVEVRLSSIKWVADAPWGS